MSSMNHAHEPSTQPHTQGEYYAYCDCGAVAIKKRNGATIHPLVWHSCELCRLPVPEWTMFA